MGNGVKHSPDVAKPRPFSVYGQGGLNEGGAGESGPVDFCAAAHRLVFAIREGADVRTGQHVRLLVAPVPQVRDGSGIDLGILVGTQASAIRHCLMDGYTFDGRVVAVVEEKGEAEIFVRGEPPS